MNNKYKGKYIKVIDTVFCEQSALKLSEICLAPVITERPGHSFMGLYELHFCDEEAEKMFVIYIQSSDDPKDLINRITINEYTDYDEFLMDRIE
jgi:hypothetical protein